GVLADVAVARPEHERLDPGIEDGPEAHRTGFAGRIEDGFGDRPAAELLRRHLDGERLRMSGGVGGRDLEALAAHDDLAGDHDDGAERLPPHPAPGFPLSL